MMEQSIGTKVTEITSEESSDTTTVTARSRKSWATRPGTRKIGRNTAMVVKVEAVMASITSFAPLMEALYLPIPSVLCRKIFSRTTMEESTIIPTPSPKPDMERIFKLLSMRYWRIKVGKTDILHLCVFHVIIN